MCFGGDELELERIAAPLLPGYLKEPEAALICSDVSLQEFWVLSPSRGPNGSGPALPSERLNGSVSEERETLNNFLLV